MDDNGGEPASSTLNSVDLQAHLCFIFMEHGRVFLRLKRLLW